MLQLLKLQWKEAMRSPAFQKNIGINIFLGFLFLYFVAVFLAVGFFVGKGLVKIYPDEDPIMLFNGFLFFYLLTDLAMRFFLQDLPTLSIQPFLHLPITRNKIIHYLLLKSTNSFFNYLPLLVFIPFSLITIAPVYGVGMAWVWVASLFLLMLANNFVATYVKRLMATNMKKVALFGLGVLTLGCLDYFDIIQLSSYSSAVFGFVLENAWMPAVFAVILVGVYVLNYQFIASNMYLESINVKKDTKADSFTDMKVFDRFGEIGRLITLEIKLILRHKRTRMAFFMSPIFLLYGLIFYSQDIYLEGYSWLMFAGIFMTGFFLINYGQYLYAWESEYFDAVLAHNIDTKNYIKAKLFLITPMVLITTLLSLFYGFITPKAIPINLAAGLYNIGINSFVLLYMSTNNSKRMILTKSDAMNFQAVSLNQFIMMIPLMVIPMLILVPFSYLDMPHVGIGLIGGLGLVSLLLYDVWMKAIVKRFKSKKYKMAAGFRQQE